jgi:hypothetical protein
MPHTVGSLEQFRETPAYVMTGLLKFRTAV